MTTARLELVDPSLTRWYHCVVRCVRGAKLLAEGQQDRKDWIENRLGHLAGIFAVSVGGFAVLDHELHVLLRLDPDVAKGWSNTEVARRWGRIVPKRDKSRQPLAMSEQWIREQARDARGIATARERLKSLSWFMKSLSEPLARLANRQDQTRGKFFEGRYKTVAILDEESLLAVSVYIDLSLAGADIAVPALASPYTSLNTRRNHMKMSARKKSLKGAGRGSVARSRAALGEEDSLWLCPIEDRRRLNSVREGMFEGLPLKSYLRLVHYTGRVLREGKAPFPRELSGIFERLGTDPPSWRSRMEALSRSRLLGRVFAASRERLREVAEILGVNHLPNLRGCPTR